MKRLHHNRFMFKRRVFLPLILTAAAGAETSFTLAGLGVTPELWNKEANFAKLSRYASQAAAAGAQVVVTPEGFLEGYVGNEKRAKDLTRKRYAAVAERIDGPMLSRVRNLARELKIYLSVGFAEAREGKFYNSAAVFSPAGGLVLHYSKTHTAADEPFNTKGNAFPVAETPLGRWGMLICMDRQMPETARILAVKGAQLILLPAWGMSGETNDIMMRTRAYENGLWVAFVHPRRVLMIDPAGKIVARDTGEGDQVVLGRIRIEDGPRRGPIRYRRPELYRELLESARPAALGL